MQFIGLLSPVPFSRDIEYNQVGWFFWPKKIFLLIMMLFGSWKMRLVIAKAVEIYFISNSSRNIALCAATISDIAQVIMKTVSWESGLKYKIPAKNESPTVR